MRFHIDRAAGCGGGHCDSHGVVAAGAEDGRDTGRLAVCLSNQKQIVLALNVYAADFNGDIPIPFEPPPTWNNWGSSIFCHWSSATGLGRLIETGNIPSSWPSRSIMLCPSEPSDKNAYKHVASNFNNQWPGRIGEMTMSYIYAGVGSATYDGLAAFKIERLSSYIATCEFESYEKWKTYVGFKKHHAGYPHVYYDGHGGTFPDPSRRLIVIYEPTSSDLSNLWRYTLRICEGRMAF